MELQEYIFLKWNPCVVTHSCTLKISLPTPPWLINYSCYWREGNGEQPWSFPQQIHPHKLRSKMKLQKCNFEAITVIRPQIWSSSNLFMQGNCKTPVGESHKSGVGEIVCEHFFLLISICFEKCPAWMAFYSFNIYLYWSLKTFRIFILTCRASHNKGGNSRTFLLPFSFTRLSKYALPWALILIPWHGTKLNYWRILCDRKRKGCRLQLRCKKEWLKTQAAFI